MSSAVVSVCIHARSPALEESIRTATSTFDAFSSPDGYGSHRGCWGTQGPALLDHRLALYDAERRMVFGATTYRQFVRLPASRTEESGANDSWVTRMRSMPHGVSTTLEGALDGPNATVVSGDAVDVVARLEEETIGAVFCRWWRRSARRCRISCDHPELGLKATPMAGLPVVKLPRARLCNVSSAEVTAPYPRVRRSARIVEWSRS